MRTHSGIEKKDFLNIFNIQHLEGIFQNKFNATKIKKISLTDDFFYVGNNEFAGI